MMWRGWLISALTVLAAGCTGGYPYYVVNDGCRCEHYTVTDAANRIVYSLAASYSVNGEIRTQVDVTIANNGRDTLDLSLAYVKVSSKNVPYRYNDRFLPINITHVAPAREEHLTLTGESVNMDVRDPWLKIAGEELVVTLKGMRINGREIPARVITFIPLNPKLRA